MTNFSRIEDAIELQEEVANLINEVSTRENARLTLAFKFCERLKLSIETSAIKTKFAESSSVQIYESGTSSYFHNSEFVKAVPQTLSALIQFETEITEFLNQVELGASRKYVELLAQKQEIEKFLVSLTGN